MDSGNAILRRFWFQNRHSLQFLRVSAARTVHYGPPLYLRARKSHTHEHMAMVYNLDQDQVILLVATNLRAHAEFNPRVFHGVVAAPDASVCRRRNRPSLACRCPSCAAVGSEGHRLLPFHGEWGAHLASTSPPLPWSPGDDIAAASFPPPGISGPGYTGHPSWVSRLGWL